MLNLFDLVLLFACGLVAMLFWQLRQISEAAAIAAQRLCQQRRLQLLNSARVHSRIGKITHGGLGWRTRYQLEFSTDGLNTLQATLIFSGHRLQDIQMPLYPEPEWQQAPTAQGRIGAGCCSTPKCGTNSGSPR